MKFTPREMYIANAAYRIGLDSDELPIDPNWHEDVIDDQGHTVEDHIAGSAPGRGPQHPRISELERRVEELTEERDEARQDCINAEGHHRASVAQLMERDARIEIAREAFEKLSAVTGYHHLKDEVFAALDTPMEVLAVGPLVAVGRDTETSRYLTLDIKCAKDVRFTANTEVAVFKRKD